MNAMAGGAVSTALGDNGVQRFIIIDGHHLQRNFEGLSLSSEIAGKINTLVENAENPYWAVEDFIRYHTAPPMVSSADCHLHDWLPAFHPTQAETNSEAQRQLVTLEDCGIGVRRDQEAFIPSLDSDSQPAAS